MTAAPAPVFQKWFEWLALVLLAAIPAAAIQLPPRFAGAPSAVTGRVPDPRATDANSFGLVGDGVHDDTEALQRAVFAPYLGTDDAPDCTTPGARVVLLHGDGRRYRLSEPVRLPIWTRLVGWGGSSRPVLLLENSTAGFGKAALPGKGLLEVVNWVPSRTPDNRTHGRECNASAATGGDTAFGTGVLNVDITINAGNPAAVGIANDAAQGGALRAMRFTLAPDALAAVFTPGWSHSDLVFDGGRFGILLFYTTWHSLVRDCAFWRQTEAAIGWQTPAISPWEGVTLQRSWFGDMPTAVDARACIGTSVRATCIDCIFRSVRTAIVRLPVVPTLEGRASVLLQRCRGDASPVLLDGVLGAFPAVRAPRSGGGGGSFEFEVKHLIAGAMVDDVRGERQHPLPSSNVSLAVRLEIHTLQPLAFPLPPDAEPAPSDLPPVPPVARWVSVLDHGLVGDGTHDCAPALNALLQKIAATQAEGQTFVLFFPVGVYAFNSSVVVMPPRGGGTVHLLGLSCWDVVLTLADGAFPNPAAPHPFLHVPAAAAAGAGKVWITGMNIRSGFSFGVPQPAPVPSGYLSPNPGAIAVLWEAPGGPAGGGMQDVFFHPNTFPDNSFEGSQSSLRPELSLVVANGGGGVFADIWSCNAYSNGGVQVANTTSPVRFSQLSSEHHYLHELWISNATDVEVHSMQTETRDPLTASSVLLENESNALVTNLYSYLIDGPNAAAVRVDASSSVVVEIYRQFHFDHPHYFNCSVLAVDALGSQFCVADVDFALANVTVGQPP